MGVKKAIIKTVKELNSADDEKIFVYGPLIHNPQTLNVLSQRGLETIDSLDNIENKAIAIRTHGITSGEYKQIKKFAGRIINLTCPRVSYVQSIIKKFANKGYHTIIVGDDGHAEIKSLKSFAVSGVSVVSSAQQLNQVPACSNYLIVAQTTLDRNIFNRVVGKASKLKGNLEIIDTICNSTRKRQNNVYERIKDGVDTLVVVGGKNSANTKRLADIGKHAGISTIHIEDEKDLTENFFKDSRHVLVTAGASTPGWIINNVLERIYNIKLKKANWLINSGKKILEFLMRTNAISAAFAFWITLFQLFYNNSFSNLTMPLISSFYIFSMYTVNNLVELKFLKKSNSNKYKIYDRFGVVLLSLAIVITGISIYFSKDISMPSRIILYSSFLFGFIYFSTPVKRILQFKVFKYFEKIYNSKLVTGFGWALICSVIPQLETGGSVYLSAFFSIHIFLLITIRQYLIDRIAYQGDFILGRETLPIWLGATKSEMLIKGVSVFLILLSSVFPLMLDKPELYVILLIYLYVYFIYNRITSKEYLIALKFEFWVDSSYLLLGLLLGCILYC